MSLLSSTVHRNLDAKMKVLGFDVPELLSVLIFAAVMNLFFARTAIAPILVIIVPALMLIALYFGKKNKPDDYLVHGARYLVSAGSYSAGEKGKFETKRKERIYECISR